MIEVRSRARRSVGYRHACLPSCLQTEFEVGRGVERLSQDWRLQPYQVSLAWLLSRPAVASVIVGAETVDEITANATAANVKLEQAQLDALTALRAGDDDS